MIKRENDLCFLNRFKPVSRFVIIAIGDKIGVKNHNIFAMIFVLSDLSKQSFIFFIANPNRNSSCKGFNFLTLFYCF